MGACVLLARPWASESAHLGPSYAQLAKAKKARTDTPMTSAAQELRRQPEERATVRLSLELSPQLNDTLEKLAERIQGSKSDVLRKAIAIMELAVRAKEEGKKFGIAERDQTLSTEIIGV